MRHSLTAGVAAVLLAGFGGESPAQVPPTPKTPDLLGIYPGMPARAARTQLQLHSRTTPISTSDSDGGLTMMLTDASRDQVNVFMTQAPNDPAVWMVRRGQNFSPSDAMSVTALTTALHEKYGKETLTMDRGGGGLYLFWIFDPNGKLLTSADQQLSGCSGGMFITYSRTGPPPVPNTQEQLCFRGFFAVTAMLNQHDAQLLQAYTVELVNLPYALSAATNTLNANSAASGQARQQQVNKADQNKPAF